MAKKAAKKAQNCHFWRSDKKVQIAKSAGNGKDIFIG